MTSVALRARHRLAAAALEGARRAPIPASLEPQLATLVPEPPAGSEWLHEVKLDGYRIVCRIDRGRAILFTRHGNDWTARLRGLARAAVQLPVDDAIIDGEVVALGPDGISSFQALQAALARRSTDDLVYFVFDLVHWDGHDLGSVALERRKDALRALVGTGPLRYSDHIVGNGPEVFRHACARGLEGIVSKKRLAEYRSGRTRSWLKAKCVKGQEFVVGGFTDPAGARTGLGALLVGYHERPGSPGLVYAGRVGTGFSGPVLSLLRKRLDLLERSDAPFVDPPRPARGIHWVEPVLVAQVAFTGWTRDHLMRHPTFRGLRDDATPQEVVLELPARAERHP